MCPLSEIVSRPRFGFRGITPLHILLAGALVSVTLAVYAPVAGFEFVAFDDDRCVYENAHVVAGLTWANVAWAFGNFSTLNWVPLAQLSHMLDVNLFGLSPGGHHVTSLFLHLLATVVLFAALTRMTAAPVCSFAAAAVFAVHPLHVESVAWVAERRDVLCGLFWMLALWAYTSYVRKPRASAYAVVLVLLALALLAKPIAVTLPIVFLLLDRWPLQRPVSLGKLVLEKLPMLGLAALAGILTYQAQKQGGAVLPLTGYPVGLRILNVLLSFAMYVIKMILPTGLTMFYPYPASIPLWQGIGAALLLIAITAGVVVLRRRCPALLAGWLWYVVTLLPVVGILHVGVQARADRATYLPLIGLGVMLGWGLRESCRSFRHGTTVVVSTGIVFLLVYATVARAQVLTWRDSLSLFKHALEVNPDNWLAENGVGLVMYRQGKIEESLPHFARAITLRPTFVRAHNNLGAALYRLGRFDEAAIQYQAALGEDPRTPTALYNLGLVLQRQGMDRDAAERFRETLLVDPSYVDASYSLARLLLRQGRHGEARLHLGRAVELKPQRVDYRVTLAQACLGGGNFEEAAVQAREALRLDPGNDMARRYLDSALARIKKRP